jgi:hypothetical protein
MLLLGMAFAACFYAGDWEPGYALGKETREAGARLRRKETPTMTFLSLVRTSAAAILAGTLVLATVGCSEPLTTREKGALLGGAGGAGIGALAGGGKGAAIGGAVGALGGAVVGDQMQRRERERYEY